MSCNPILNVVDDLVEKGLYIGEYDQAILSFIFTLIRYQCVSRYSRSHSPSLPSTAFPTAGNAAQKDPAGCPFAASSAGSKRQYNAAPSGNFDPVKQKIDVTGKYAFKPPGPGDKRALANHGYIPRNGTPFMQAVEASNKVFGMSKEIGLSLSIVACVLTGNPTTLDYSIGGSPGGLNIPLLLSAPQGLSGAHNKFEGDGSPTRSDLYMNNGDASTMNLEYFKQLSAMKSEEDPNANFDYDTMITHRANRFNTSVSENPHFFYGPITGVFLQPGAHGSFFGVSGSGNNLTYLKGHDRIPDNWYRRPNDYTLVEYLLDVVYAAGKYPQFISIGGNTGKVNSFAGVSLDNLTGGVYNSANILQGNNLVCFTYQVLLNVTPDILRGTVAGLLLTNVLGLLSKTLSPILSGFTCPELIKYDGSVFKPYPGAGAAL
ncbi:Peroxidase, family 2 [Rhizoctonia solani]|uniref:Peroxidase, family 2 n=1 Tax=Rhizoctonia solani TaxID=456999 RepID=A0A8H7I7V9_9AGAM|nr:Peroxidase, family 2 [Rhizoctonia solani]